MTVHYECTGYWKPPCDVMPGDELDYDPERGAVCPECGNDIQVLIETVFMVEAPDD